MNPRSGRTDADLDELREHFADFDIVEASPEQLESSIHAAAADASVIAVAGGDGTVSTAARCLRGTSVALVVIPEGTRNHFAHDVGVGSLGDAATAARRGRPTKVDLGTANDDVFVNNASIGAYARLVRRREKHQKRWRKSVANIVAAWDELRRGHRTQVEIDGARRTVWAVFIGNGRYGSQLGDITTREAVDDGVLDVWVLAGRGRFDRARIAFAVLFGRLDHSPLIDRSTTTALSVDHGSKTIDVALDGEVSPLDAPVRFGVDPAALTVLTPPSESVAH